MSEPRRVEPITFMRGMGPEQATETSERSLRDYYQPLRDQPEPELDPERTAFRETIKAGGVEAMRVKEQASEAPPHPSLPFQVPDSDIPEV